jgi:hypothetical protein
VGVAGAVVGAPRNALQYFHNAAEAWRQDQLDQGNAAWKQFTAEMQAVKAENDQRLEIYDIAAKRYGANQVAHHAAVVTALEAVGQTDAAYTAAARGIDHQLAVWNAQRQGIKDIEAARTAYDTETTKMLELAEKINKSGATKSLPEINDALSRNPPPEERARLEWARQQALDIEKWRIQARGELTMADGIIRDTEKQQAKIPAALDSIDGVGRALQTIVQKAPQLLTASPATPDKWVAWVQQRYPDNYKDPEVLQAVGVLHAFYTAVRVQYERGIMDVRGNAAKAVYGLDKEAVTIASAQEMYGQLKLMRQNLLQQQERNAATLEQWKDARTRALTPPSSAPPPGSEAEAAPAEATAP